MQSAEAPRCSIIVPHYRTEEIVRLCLRALRKHSRLSSEVIVVDNNSGDVSLEYLRSLSWIRLIENPTAAQGSRAHREALALGVPAATGDWLLLFHSDAIVLRDGWDEWLIGMAEAAGAAGFSTTIRNLDAFDAAWRRQLHRAGDALRDLRLAFAGREHKLMSYCFGVRRELVAQSGFDFRTARDAGVTDFYRQVIRGRHPFLLLDRATLEPLIWHTSNVTSVLNEQITDARTVARFRRRYNRLAGAEAIRALSADASLDR